MEYVGPKYRTLVANLSLLLFYTPFTMLMPWIALASGTWRTFAIMASLPLWLALFSYCILPESARWVRLEQGRKSLKELEFPLSIAAGSFPWVRSTRPWRSWRM